MCPTQQPDFYVDIFSSTLGGATFFKMIDEILKVTYNELTQEYKDLVEKLMEEV